MHAPGAIIARAVVDEGAQARFIQMTQPLNKNDSGLVIRTSLSTPFRVEDFTLVCTHCLIEHHPELAPGMDIAKKHGESFFRAGRWWAPISRNPIEGG